MIGRKQAKRPDPKDNYKGVNLPVALADRIDALVAADETWATRAHFVRVVLANYFRKLDAAEEALR